jgi:uncharacterized protein (TIGR02594 family)
MIQEKYKWLETVEKPKLVEAALQYLGIKEIPGKGSNPVILNMAKQIGLGTIYKNDDTSWCAVFINFLCHVTGKPLSPINGDIYNLMRAKAFANWGTKVSLKEARIGDVVVINRTGGGHVFILIATTNQGNLVGIGGNQSNAVTIAEFDVKRIADIRRHYASGLPTYAKQYEVDGGGKFSSNEA